MKEEKFPNTRKLSHQQVCGRVLESQRATKLGGGEKNTEYTPNHNSQRRSSLDACVLHHRVGAEREARVACLG